MAAFTVCTWNVNSVRAHLATVERFFKERRPEVLCLQETKVADAAFPLEPFRTAGYQAEALNGGRGAYHGVAVFSRGLPLDKVRTLPFCNKGDPRHLSCLLPGGIELHNFYVPAGGDVPDPAANPKFAHKLDFLDQAAAWFGGHKKRSAKLVLVGDLNVAPLETDVWSHKQLLKVVSHTPIEVEKLDRWQRSHDFVDAVRHFVPPEHKLFTWWSYRSPNWLAADKGRRLDHVWVSPALRGRLKSAEIFKPARGWEPTSDHVPVLVEMSI
ncbi:MAG: exodeoxyribonuclease III [Alphaproteobacteria bacterium]|nr:exodeoxyribonuclease III [Alphaproteobacteria bacterium]